MNIDELMIHTINNQYSWRHNDACLMTFVYIFTLFLFLQKNNIKDAHK